MRRLVYIILTTITLGSCSSSDEMLQPNGATLNEIILAPVLNEQSSTKGSIMESTTDLEGSTFMLYATAYDNTTASDYPVASAEIGHTTSGGWSPIEGHKIYWPTSESDVTFYAWHPADLEIALHSGKELYFACDTKAADVPTDSALIELCKDSESGDVVHLYDGKAGVQDDIMCCTTTKTNPTQQSVSGSDIDYEVKLDFQHVLTNLRFKYKTVDGVEVRIKAIMLHNIISQGGFFSYSNGSYAWATYSVDHEYDYYKDTRPNYQCVPMAWGASKFVTSTHGEVEISGENDMFVIPQKVVAWVPYDGQYTFSIAHNDANEKQAYLQIYCDIETTHGTDEIGDDKTYSDVETMAIDPDACIYVPISSQDSSGNETWEAGNIVTYTLTFGTGYKADGTKNGDFTADPSPINVEVTATLNKWNDGGNYGVEF